MRNKKDLISKDDREDCKFKLQKYFNENFEDDLSGLQATLLIDFIEESLGKYFYNKGVEDSIVAIKDKSDDLYLLMED